MESIFFHIMHVIEEAKTRGERFIHPTKNTFENIENSFDFTMPDGSYYEVNVDKTDEFIWFSFDFGKPNPRDDKLTHVQTGDKRKNERSHEEAELIHQFFCLYCFETKLCFLSNAKKKGVMEALIQQKTKRNLIFKGIKKSKEEFIELLKSVNTITFTDIASLFGNDSKKRQALKDLTGIDAPTKFTIEANYNEANKIKNFLAQLFQEKDKHLMQSLIIKGKDESNFDVIFNNDTFSKKTEIKCEKDENGKFDSEEVKEILLKALVDEG